MQPGDLVDDRFELVSLAGTGGMGAVYRARDRRNGSQVALKVMSPHVEAAARFVREAEVLRRLAHPGVVRYVAHGRAGGAPYLAMEWLEGEDLAERLSRGPIPFAEAVALAIRVASALGAAHAAGVVHRDIKPSNLFLPGGDVAAVKVLDFGIARVAAGRTAMTRAGAMLGTPAYMAPEQARGQKDLDARADVFSLGCVLFECLTGQAPFSAADMMAVLAKILLDDAPRLAPVVGVPPALDDLVDRMLSKEAARRPADGAAVARELSAVGGAEPTPRHAPAPPPSLTGGELRMICVVLVAPPAGEGVETAPTVGAVDGELVLAPIRAAVLGLGLRLEALADGSLIGTLSGAGVATDHAAQAARAALALAAALPEATIALTTGRALVTERWPIGEAIDRAAALVRAADARAAGSPRGAGVVAIDDPTAALLGERFEVSARGALGLLHRERELAAGARTLLGRTTSCVGRERELSTLAGIYRDCVEDSMSCLVLVTGEAGIGKSRLRHELLHALAQGEARPEVWMGRGDPISAGAPFSLVAPALRRAAGILDGEPIAARRAKLIARVERHVAPRDRRRVAEFLGELVGAPFPDDASVALCTARDDAASMGDQVRRAWEDFLAAETSAHPVLLVLDDLQWGDRPSLKLVDVALRALGDKPLMVLALARPDVRRAFPDLWSARRFEEIRLGPLRRSGGERLVREVLGDRADDELVARLVARSEGNAFYLEELIRAAAEGEGEALPETVLAMVERRLEGLDPEARRALRAASVFGQVFWGGAIAALLGGEAEETLRRLVDRELCTRQHEARFPGEAEYAFRNALVREAAYSMLTDADRRLGHLLAGRWLEEAGETDAYVLGEHFERGGDPALAVGCYARAAEQALDANDFAGAVDRAARAARCGASGETLGALRVIEAEAHSWQGDNARSETLAMEAMELLPRGGELWFAAAGWAAIARAKFGHIDRLVAVSDEMRGMLDRGHLERRGAIAAAQTLVPLLLMGQNAQADAMRATLEALPERLRRDPAIEARLEYGRAVRSSMHGDPSVMLDALAATVTSFDKAGLLRNACMQRANLGYGLMKLGAYEEAVSCLRDALASAERLGLPAVSATAKHNLGLALAYLGALDEALAAEADAANAFAAQGDHRMEGASRNYLALIRILAGDPTAAEPEARAAVELLGSSAPIRAYATSTLAHALLASGRTSEALAVARETMALLEELGGIEEGESQVRLVHAEALLASGEREAARAAIIAARDRLAARAEKLTDTSRRATFLEAVPEHARTFELARVLHGER